MSLHSKEHKDKRFPTGHPGISFCRTGLSWFLWLNAIPSVGIKAKAYYVSTANTYTKQRFRKALKAAVQERTRRIALTEKRKRNGQANRRNRAR